MQCGHLANGSVGVGQIFGIPIEIHWTLILFSLLLLLVIPAVTFMLLVLLYVCVLAHELAHSGNAIRNGLKVKRIILSLMGGASIIDDISIDPKVEFNITMVGPIMSIFLGALFGVLEIFTGPGTISYMLNWLFLWNMFLGIFNLVPIFPLDGGRIMRSYLQRKTNFYNATMTTARISKYLMGVFVISMGAYVLLDNQAFIYNELLAFITFFTIFYIYGGLKAETNAAVIKRDTKGLRISAITSKDFTLISPNATIGKIYSHMMSGKSKIFVMKQEDGIYLLNLNSKPKDNIMQAKDLAFKIPTVESNCEVADALDRMESEEVGIAAVQRRGRFMGIVSASQIQSFIFLHMLKEKYEKTGKV